MFISVVHCVSEVSYLFIKAINCKQVTGVGVGYWNLLCKANLTVEHLLLECQEVSILILRKPRLQFPVNTELLIMRNWKCLARVFGLVMSRFMAVCISLFVLFWNMALSNKNHTCFKRTLFTFYIIPFLHLRKVSGVFVLSFNKQ